MSPEIRCVFTPTARRVECFRTHTMCERELTFHILEEEFEYKNEKLYEMMVSAQKVLRTIIERLSEEK